ncbi:hypothetical protein HOY82DRAFT_600279 [Tuber indicum]|nr:hypothetical protein HOY82DRAFT_600279 [Tuber indicum]
MSKEIVSEAKITERECQKVVSRNQSWDQLRSSADSIVHELVQGTTELEGLSVLADFMSIWTSTKSLTTLAIEIFGKGNRIQGKRVSEEKEEVAFRIVPDPIVLPLVAVVSESIVAGPSREVAALVVVGMDMGLTEEEKKRKMYEVVVTPLGPKTSAAGKGKVVVVIVTDGVLDVTPKSPRFSQQYMKAEMGRRTAGGLRIRTIASPIPKVGESWCREDQEQEVSIGGIYG